LIPIEVLDRTPSTMDEARERVRDGRFCCSGEAFSCSCVMALEQTSGRGQRGRQWFARRGQSLSATYMVRCSPLTDPARSQNIGLIAGVALAEVMARRSPGIDVGLKWPNDLLLNGKKAGGILVEMVTSPDADRVALIGMGVNVAVSEFPDDLTGAATSMIREGVPLERLPDLKALTGEIGESLAAHITTSCTDPTDCIRLWRRFDATTGRQFESTMDGVTVTGVAEGIDDHGALVLRLDDGTHIPVTSATSLREIPVR
jgi:BirA family biotin operon repressor/biotin-[acetyl-CoA-carboxylase] ligase